MKTFKQYLTKQTSLPYAIILRADSKGNNDVIWILKTDNMYDARWAGRNDKWKDIDIWDKNNPNNYVSYEILVRGEDPDNVIEMTKDEFSEYALLNL